MITRLLEDYWIGRRAQVQVDCAGVSPQVNDLDVAVVPLVQGEVGWRGALVLADCGHRKQRARRGAGAECRQPASRRRVGSQLGS